MLQNVFGQHATACTPMFLAGHPLLRGFLLASFPGDGIVPSRRFEKPRLRTSGQPEGGRSLQELSRRHLAVHGLTYLLQWFFRSVASRRNLVDLVSQLEARRNDHDITIFVFAFNVYIVLLSVMKFSDNFSLPGTRHVCLQVCNTRFQRIL